MKILVADDEPLARLRLKRLLEEINPQFQVFADAGNGLQALQQCLQYQPDIALLDIRMPKMDGLQTAAELLKAGLKSHIIFVTAYDEYALAAFDTHAIDYLLKPVKKQRLEQSFAKIDQLSQLPSSISKVNQALLHPRQHLCAHNHQGLQIMDISDVLYFKAEHKYVLAKSTEQSVLLDESLKTLELEFNELFFRVHRNALVNIQAILSVTKSDTNQCCIQLRGSDETLIVSRRHQAELNRLLRQNSLPAK